MFDKYYEEELRYLYDSGHNFAQTHPDAAQRLNIDAVGDRDPIIERLFEGFAFFGAGIRERLDDSFPELHEALHDLSTPWFRQEIPSLTLIQFTPRRGLLYGTKTLPRGIEILSSPLEDSTVCSFQTDSPVNVHPISIYDLAYSNSISGNGSLTFHFSVENGVNWKDLQLFPLRVQIYGDISLALRIHKLITYCTENVSFQFNCEQEQYTLPGAKGVLFNTVLDSNTVLPHVNQNEKSKLCLLEYALFPWKYLCFDLGGFEDVKPSDSHDLAFSITLHFNTEIPHDLVMEASNFKLYCTSAINLFKSHAAQIPTNEFTKDYLVKWEGDLENSVFPHSIIDIQATNISTGEKRTISPSHTFETFYTQDNFSSYSVKYEHNTTGIRDLYISLKSNNENNFIEEVISAEIYCTNGLIPADNLGTGDIHKGGTSFPDYIQCANLTKPTQIAFPPRGRLFPWKAIGLQSLSCNSFMDISLFKEVMELNNWSGNIEFSNLIESFSKIEIKDDQIIKRGILQQGTHIILYYQVFEEQVAHSYYLFGQILGSFFSQFIPVNSYCKLSLINLQSSQRIDYPPVKGIRCAL